MKDMIRRRRTRPSAKPGLPKHAQAQCTSIKNYLRILPNIATDRLAVNKASKSTKVQILRTCLQSSVLELSQRVSQQKMFCKISRANFVTLTIFLFLFISTTLVSSLPVGMDAFLDIDESEYANSRPGLETTPLGELSEKDMEMSAKTVGVNDGNYTLVKEFLGKFGYVQPAEWNDVAPRTWEELEYGMFMDESESSGNGDDYMYGSGDGRDPLDINRQGANEVLTWRAELISEEQYHEALIKYQTMNRLNATGELDNDTASFMGQPRCGVPDRTAGIKEHRREELAIEDIFETNSSLTLNTAEFEANNTIQRDDSNVNVTTRQTPTTAQNDMTSGDYEPDLARSRRSVDVEADFAVEYGKTREESLEYLIGAVSEARLPEESRLSELESILSAMRQEKLSMLNATKEREILREEKSQRPMAALPSLVYRMVMETRASRNKRSESYMRDSGWMKAFSKPVITWRLVEEWQSKRSFLTPTEIWFTIKYAFRMWSEIIPKSFREDRTSPIVKVDILIGFGTKLHNRCRVPFRDSSITKEYAHAWPLPRAEIHFNDDQPFVSAGWDAATDLPMFKKMYSSRVPISLFKVAVHEIGHTLGLPHINRRDSVMSPVYFPFQSNKLGEIGIADRVDIQRLYGPCYNSFDAVFDWVRLYVASDGSIKRKFNTFFFKRNWFWVYDNGGRRPTYGDPRLTKTAWRGILDGPTDGFNSKIDGVVHIRDWSLPDGPIYFFIGDSFVEYDNIAHRVKTRDSKGRSYPRKISDEFPGIPSHIDTVFYKMEERMLYFFKGNLVYRYDWRKRRVVSRNLISLEFPGWGGAKPLPSNIDAAYFSYTYHAYFFYKGPFYWKMAGDRERVANKGIPIPENAVGPMRVTASKWLYICDVHETEFEMN